MEEALKIGLLALLVSLWVYVLGRITMKAWLKELDLFLGKKFTNYIHKTTKKKEDGKEEK